MNKSTTIISLLILLMSCQLRHNSDSVVPARLQVNRQVDPAGIETPQPLFSWVVESDRRGASQASYHILVASSVKLLNENKGDVWDSGTVESLETTGIPYRGKVLSSRQVCWWKVKIRDENQKESSWSNTGSWSMGLLMQSDWKAHWIGLERPVGTDQINEQHPRVSARMLRKEIVLDNKIERATLYVCGLGLFEYYINGQKIGNGVLTPALAQYNKRAYYMTYDVTDYLEKGANTLGIWLGNGRYCPVRQGDLSSDMFGYPKVIQQLEIKHEDGTTETIISNESWKLTTKGPIIANNEYDGEEYDATKEMEGWNKVGFDDSAWIPAELVKKGAPLLTSQPSPPIKIMDTLLPISVWQAKTGAYIYDMGQNMTGWVKLKVKGERGTCVQMRFAETLQSDSSLYTASLRTALVTDKYILKGEGVELFEPRFSYHGFRYVELTGFPGVPDLSSVEGQVIYDEMETIGTFETSDSIINTIYHNACWGIKSNYRSIPTDCPQRDERQGWLGDRTVGAKGESFLFNNNLLYAKWLQDIRDAQYNNGSIPNLVPTFWDNYNDNITWPGAYLMIGDMLYTQFADIKPIQDNYKAYSKWMQRMHDLYLKDGIMTCDYYGDWCMPPERKEMIFSKDSSRITDGNLIGSAYYYYMLSLMQKFAGLLNYPNDRIKYEQLADTVYAAYNAAYLHPTEGYYSNNTVTANLLSLAYGLVPKEYKMIVFNQLVNKTTTSSGGRISTGVAGAQWIMRVLTGFGRADIAYDLTTHTDYPSWGYMVKKGATTIWELWNGDTADPAMNSGNHIMLLGDLLIWYYENLAGIQSDPSYPGFQHIRMKPTLPDKLNYVKASYNSVRGIIKSEWHKSADQFNWCVTIPANCSATIYIPADNVSKVWESGKKANKSEGVSFLQMEDGYAVFRIQSGGYKFRSNFMCAQSITL